MHFLREDAFISEEYAGWPEVSDFFSRDSSLPGRGEVGQNRPAKKLSSLCKKGGEA